MVDSSFYLIKNWIVRTIDHANYHQRPRNYKAQLSKWIKNVTNEQEHGNYLSKVLWNRAQYSKPAQIQLKRKSENDFDNQNTTFNTNILLTGIREKENQIRQWDRRGFDWSRGKCDLTDPIGGGDLSILTFEEEEEEREGKTGLCKLRFQVFLVRTTEMEKVKFSSGLRRSAIILFKLNLKRWFL